MENEVLRDILLVLTVLAVFVVGFFVMKRLDKFLNENYKFDQKIDIIYVKGGNATQLLHYLKM